MTAERFSAGEMARRFDLALSLAERESVRALVVFGSSETSSAYMANAYWLSNHLDLHHCYVVLPADPAEEAALFTGLTNHVPNAREVSDVPSVEWGGYRPGETIARRLRELDIETGRVGLVGANAKWGVGMPYGHYLDLRADLPGVELVDLTGAFQRLRLVKSGEEIEWLRRAAELTDRAILAAAAHARPGVSEIELIASAEAAFRPAGGTPRIMFLRSMAMDDPTGCLPAQHPSERRLAAGDVIITELSASYRGYTGQIHRPIFVGAEPTSEWQRLFEVAKAAYDGIERVARSGATEADVLRAAEPIRDAGYTIYDDLIHGYGVDIMPPVTDRAQFDSRPDEEGMRLEAGMAIVIQPNPVTPDERMGLQLGALTIVRDGGAECLQRVPFEPLLAG